MFLQLPFVFLCKSSTVPGFSNCGASATGPRLVGAGGGGGGGGGPAAITLPMFVDYVCVMN